MQNLAGTRLVPQRAGALKSGVGTVIAMRSFLLTAAVLFSLGSLAAPANAQQEGKRIVAYYTAWSIYALSLIHI